MLNKDWKWWCSEIGWTVSYVVLIVYGIVQLSDDSAVFLGSSVPEARNASLQS